MREKKADDTYKQWQPKAKPAKRHTKKKKQMTLTTPLPREGDLVGGVADVEGLGHSDPPDPVGGIVEVEGLGRSDAQHCR